MGWLAEFKAGRAMTKLANLLEEVNRNKTPTGSYLPPARLADIEREARNCMFTLRTFPRHVVTENLLKNIRIASRLGDQTRMQAYADMLNGLVEEGIALDLDTFEKSYTR